MERKRPARRKRTGTSAFGVPGRSSHDSSRFYGAKLYDGLDSGGSVEYKESPVPARHLNRIYCKSSEHMEELPDKSVHLMVTSPPYNAGKQYDGDMSLDEYLGLLKSVLAETYRVLVPGGAPA